MVKKILFAIILALFIVGTQSLASLHAFTNRPSKPPVGARIDPLHHINRDLVAWWLFNDMSGSLLNDITGKHNGSLINMDADDWVGSPKGGALDFDGSNDYLNIVNNSLFENMVANVNKTLAIWFNADTLAAESASHLFPSLMNKGNVYMNFGVDDSGELAFYWFDQSSVVQIILTSGAGISTGLWYHGVVVLNEGTATLYANGVNKGSGSFNGMHTGATGEPEWFGTTGGTQGTQRWDGKMDNARIYNRALSADEVAELYRNPHVGLLPRPVKWYGVDDPPASFTPTVTWW